MNFGAALERMKKGESIARVTWSTNRRIYIDSERIFFLTSEGSEGAYIASSKDLLAEDWVVLGDPQKTAVELIAEGDPRLTGD